MNKKYILARTVYGFFALLFCLMVAGSILSVFILRSLDELITGAIMGVAAFFTFRRWLYWQRMAKKSSGYGSWVILSFPVLLVVFAIGMSQLWSVRKIETLTNPISVTSWTTNGFVLANGRTIPLPGLLSIPLESAAISEVTKRGIEIGTNGRIYGLVRVHHWCGNDRVREQIARVDIADMLMFLKIGEPKLPDADPYERTGDFSPSGWRVGQFYRFQRWEKTVSSLR